MGFYEFNGILTLIHSSARLIAPFRCSYDTTLRLSSFFFPFAGARLAAGFFVFAKGSIPSTVQQSKQTKALGLVG